MAKTFRFIHCADLHLGSPFRSLAPLEDRWKRIVGDATLKAFHKIVQLAIDKRVHALIISGDIYNSASHNLTAQLDFVRRLHTLAAHEIPVFIAYGNHDKRKFLFRRMCTFFRRIKRNEFLLLSKGKNWLPYTVAVTNVASYVKMRRAT